MKLSLSLLSLILSFSVATQARSLPFLGGETAQHSLNDVSASDDLTVPGDSPLKYCEDPEDYILTIDHVNLDPNPPKPGQNLTVECLGTLTKDVEDGSKVFLEVKYGPIKIINQEVDLCEQAQNVNKSCPLEKGELKFTKTVMIPEQVPNGKYFVKGNVYTKDKNETITCLEASAQFP